MNKLSMIDHYMVTTRACEHCRWRLDAHCILPRCLKYHYDSRRRPAGSQDQAQGRDAESNKSE